MAAERGLEASGIDAAPTAIAAAQRKAEDRGLHARFLVWDALRLDELGEHFDTVLDSGLFHVFDDDGRARYVEALAAVLEPCGRSFLCCFSDRQPGDWGPRRSPGTTSVLPSRAGGRWSRSTPRNSSRTSTRHLAEAWLATITRG